MKVTKEIKELALALAEANVKYHMVSNLTDNSSDSTRSVYNEMIIAQEKLNYACKTMAHHMTS